MKQLILMVMVCCSALVTSAQLTVGTPAPEISLPDTRDSILHLSSLKGKVVLIDFWASWCGPCRESNPSVVRLYNKYKAKGFEVFAVSIDSKKNKWINAIKQDRLNYLQVNDNTGWRSVVAESYGVVEIPTTFLLDKEGKIVAVDAEGADLENKVKKLLKAPAKPVQ